MKICKKFHRPVCRQGRFTGLIYEQKKSRVKYLIIEYQSQKGQFIICESVAT